MHDEIKGARTGWYRQQVSHAFRRTSYFDQHLLSDPAREPLVLRDRHGFSPFTTITKKLIRTMSTMYPSTNT